jgi:hypothetical protein
MIMNMRFREALDIFKNIIMRKMIVLILAFVLNSCGFNLEQKVYNFDNFKETSLWDLAKAVRADDPIKVKQILKDKTLEIDLKEPKYHQTLLALSIQNYKRNAFLELLKAGAKSNELVGNSKYATPFIYGIRNVEDCDLFYVENMLKHGADPNFEIKNPEREYYFDNSFPLLVAIGKNDNNANDCLNLIKLLVDNGADINVCYQQSDSDLCEGVIAYSLISNSMETLKYFVIEKRITISDTVFISGFDKSDQKAYGLREMLTTEQYKYDDFESETGKHDRSQMRKTRDEILEYLDKIGK